jgi:prolyl 4-hydroxylase
MNVGSEASGQAYIGERVAQGRAMESIRDDLAAMGWHPGSIERALQRFARGDAAPAASCPAPAPDLDRLPTRLDIDGHVVDVQLRLHRPRLCVLGNVLAPEECAALIELSRPRMERSMVIVGDGDVDEEGVLAYSRTSEQAAFRRGASPLVDRIQRRVAQLVRWPEDHMESLQVVRYGVGADFAPHHDYFCPRAHADMIAREGQRVGTLLMYLNTPDSGGVTSFPDVELEVYPQQGTGLFFAYPDAHPDSLTLHAGAPLGGGEKWIATFFLHDRAIPERAGARPAAAEAA